jgi:hypothetical protein
MGNYLGDREPSRRARLREAKGWLRCRHAMLFRWSRVWAGMYIQKHELCEDSDLA